VVEIVSDSRYRSGREENDTEFRSFATDTEFFFGEIDLVPIESRQFRDAETSGKEELEEGTIPPYPDTVARGCRQKPLHLVVLEEVNLAFGNSADFDLFSRESGNIVFCQML
jgi:hypothetical protein